MRSSGSSNPKRLSESVRRTGASPNLWYSSTSGADGTYSVSVPSGSYYVEFEDPSYTYVWGYYGSSGFTRNKSTLVPVGSTNVSGINVVLPANLRISGKVAGGGSGLAGVQVLPYYSTTNTGVANAHPYLTTNCVTGVDGTFSCGIDPLDTGYFWICFGNTDTYYGGWYGNSGWVPVADQAKVLHLTTSDITGINIDAAPLFHITGELLLQSPGTAYVAACTPTYCLPEQTVGMYTEEFDLSVPSGLYVVQVEASTNGYYGDDGFVYYLPEATTLDARSVDVTGLVITVPLNSFGITGFVTDSDSKGISGVDVFLLGAGGAYVADEISNSSGLYVFDDLPAGSYTLEFVDFSGLHASGFYSAAGLTYDYYSAGKVDLWIASASDLDVVLPPLHDVFGQVTDSSNVGIGGAVVSGYVSGVYYAGVTTSGTGSYLIRMPPGDATFHVSDPSAAHVSGWYVGPGISYGGVLRLL
jgi:hypothetical protein